MLVMARRLGTGTAKAPQRKARRMACLGQAVTATPVPPSPTVTTTSSRTFAFSAPSAKAKA